jgi:RIO kinase 1
MLRDVKLGHGELVLVRHTLLEYMDLCYNRAGLVHGDLSEYNVLINGQDTVLIDVGQAVVLEHPMAQELFVRDLKTIAAYFKRKGAGFDWNAVHNQIITHGATGKGVVHEEE